MVKKANKTFRKRRGKKNNHHILPKKRGGKKRSNNLIWLDINRHAAFHLIFQNKTFIEAARLLIRTHNMITGENVTILMKERR